MAIEIERKFLVKDDFRSFAIGKKKIVQGYLSLNPERSVRIRIAEDKACITVKGIATEGGLTRFEWEKEIELHDAENLLKICETNILEKFRYIIPEKSGLIFEVDEFLGLNQGLVIAEIELPESNYQFIKPTWLGEEVTGDKRYYNVFLSANPFSKWI